MKDFKITIVGGGLVGPLCALFLIKRGYNVEVYEYRDDPKSAGFLRGRSINLALSNRGRRALRAVGLEEEVLKHGTKMKGRYIHNSNSKNKSILYDTRNNECIYSIERQILNSALYEATQSHSNIKWFFNHKLVNVNVEMGKAIFLQTKTNTTVEVFADLIIGADGAFSAVRRSMQKTSLFSYSQTYIDHGYIEMTIKPELGHKMVPNHLHIWPRGTSLLIALPNNDGSWTVTLFMPFQKFDELNTRKEVLNFYETFFPDIIDLIGKDNLLNNFFKFKPGTLVSIKCDRYHYKNKVLIIGDAAHAMVPFYGQGMNAGFEDCYLLNSLLNVCDDDFIIALPIFTEKRKADAHAICDLAMYNYTEMKDLVRRPSYLIRKKIDDTLYKVFPKIWFPLYNAVTFEEMGYQKCMENRKWQNHVIKMTIVSVSGLFCLLGAVILLMFL